MYQDIQRYNQLSSAERELVSRDEVPLKAATLHSRLNLLQNFFIFLKEQYIYAGLTANDIEAANLRLTKLKTTLLVSLTEVTFKYDTI